MSSSAIRAGRAFVELFADDSKLVRGLRAASRKLQAFGSSVRTMGLRTIAGGAAIAAPFILAAKHFATVGDKINKMQARTGIAADALSQLGFAAQQSGSNLDTFESGVKRMQGTLADAMNGSESARQSFARLGLNVDQLAQLSPDEQFKSIADAIAGVNDPAQRAAMAMDIFGRSGQKLVPLLAQGRAGINSLMQEADRLGLTIDGETAQSAADLADAWNRVKQTLQGVVLTIGSAVAPMLTKFANNAAAVITTAIEWIKNNRALVATVFKVAAAVVAGGAALVALGAAIGGLGFIVSGLATGIAAVGAFLGTLGTIAGALISPIGLVAAAVVGIGGAFLYASGTGGRMLDFLSGVFSNLKQLAGDAFGGIAAALSGGDIVLAGQILWATLKVLWEEGTTWLLTKWIDFQQNILGFDVAAKIGQAWEFLKGVFAAVVDFGLAAWEKLVGFASQAWEQFGGTFEGTSFKLTDVFFGAVKGIVDGIGMIRKAWIEVTAFMRDAWILMGGGIASAWTGILTVVDTGITLLMQRIKQIVDLAGQLSPALKAALPQEVRDTIDTLGSRTLDDVAGAGRARLSGIANDTIGQIGDSDSQRRGDLANVDASTAATKRLLDEQQAALEAASNASLNGRRKGAGGARQELAELLARSRDLGNKAAEPGRQADQFDKVEGVAGARDDFVKKASVAGTFSGSALSGLGADTLGKAQLDEAKEQNKKLDEIDQALKHNKLQFLA